MLKKLDTLNESVDNDFETGMTVNKSIISIKKQGPIYGFGTGSRDAIQKTFVDNELLTSLGVSSPGPMYKTGDRGNFKTPSKMSIGKSEKIILGKKLHYSHYDNKDNDSDLVGSKYKNARKPGFTKFGRDTRKSLEFV